VDRVGQFFRRYSIDRDRGRDRDRDRRRVRARGVKANSRHACCWCCIVRLELHVKNIVEQAEYRVQV